MYIAATAEINDVPKKKGSSKKWKLIKNVDGSYMTSTGRVLDEEDALKRISNGTAYVAEDQTKLSYKAKNKFNGFVSKLKGNS